MSSTLEKQRFWKFVYCLNTSSTYQKELGYHKEVFNMFEKETLNDCACRKLKRQSVIFLLGISDNLFEQSLSC